MTAEVNLDHVLDTVARSDLETGAWINVIGYVNAGFVRRQTVAGITVKENIVPVQAVMLWNAGAINVQEYERALMARMEAAAQNSRQDALPIHGA